jgi:hypothetical protein
VRVQNLEKLLRAHKHRQRWQIIANTLLINLPLRNLVLRAVVEITFRVHSAELLLKVDACEIYLTLTVVARVYK